MHRKHNILIKIEFRFSLKSNIGSRGCLKILIHIHKCKIFEKYSLQSLIHLNSLTPPTDSSCLWNQFACSKNKCIAKQWVCDGEDDCGDGLDESEEVCGKTERRKFTFRTQNE